ncbi:MAG: hypothetical protein LUI05_03915 [Oscillospiraceae bacterium]|nr:hypothetical protein [Oscillospiraceae bacterium]
MRRLLLSVLAAAVLLCGCSDETDDLDERSFDGSYHVIADGTAVLIEGEDVSEQKTAVYIPDGMETVYASAHLDEGQREIYDMLVESIGNCEQKAPMLADASVYTTLLNLISIEQLGYGHISGRKVGEYDMENQYFPVEFTYRYTPEEMSNMNRSAEGVANEIISGITDDMTVYDKLKYFHDYLITHCESDEEDEYANTIYGALVRGKALCEGYAKSFSYLCNKVGIENMIVTGSTDVAHMWNMVKVDGNWYHVDVTWDKPEGALAEEYPDIIMYQYFMVTDSVIENDHDIWTLGYTPPHAYSTKENYFVKEGLYISDESELESIIENAFRKSVSNHSSTAMVKFDTTNLMLSTMRNLAESAENGGDYLKSVIDRVSDNFGVKLNVSWTDYYSPYRTLVFVIEYGSGGTED